MKSTLQLFKTFLFLFFIIISNKIFSQDGTLDLSFGDGGKVSTDFNHTNELGFASILEPDGKILVAGNFNSDINDPTYSDFAIARYLSNGKLDSSFGDKGKTVIDIFNQSVDNCATIGLQQSKIILTGNSNTAIALVRLNQNGLIDSSFGNNGITIQDGFYTTVLASIIQPDNKIVTAGQGHSSKYPLTGNVFVLNRFNVDGTLDSSFGDNGISAITFGNGYKSTANALVLQKDGKLIAGGFTDVPANNNLLDAFLALVRFNSNGSVDSSFGNNGKDSINIGTPYDYGLSLALQKNQKIIVSSFKTSGSNNAFTVLRFNKDGGIDSSFGKTGLTATKISDSNEISSVFDKPYGITIDSNERILQTGITFNESNLDFALVRYKNDGLLDSSFATNGIQTTDFGKGDDASFAIAIQPDNKIVVVGNAFNGSDYDFALARYNNDNILPLSFLSFNATKQNQSVLLNWQTTNEINNNYFSVERSNNNKNFSGIYKVYSTNNPSKINSYTSTDVQPLKGWNYYRLKQVDKDGKFSYSSIAAVLFNNEILISIYPNPANNFIYVDGLKEGHQSTIIINDANGKTIATVSTSSSQYKFDLQKQSTGIYYITVQQDGTTIKQKFVKQ